MSEMATDDVSDGVGFSMKISEFIKLLNTKQERRDPHEPLPVYTPEDKWAFLKRLPKTTVRPNPYAINELIQRGEARQKIDLYAERRHRERDETPKVDLEAIEAVITSKQKGQIDLYRERLLRRYQK